ncbi:MAG: hypothetical protein IK077_00915 [Thermoguttaceae bacterium]|nr:hypothetical protein [Thermoguttaceae bacterium]
MNINLRWYDALVVVALIAAFGILGAFTAGEDAKLPSWLNYVMIGIAAGYFVPRFQNQKKESDETTNADK